MIAKLHFWWNKAKKSPRNIIISIAIIVLAALIILVILGIIYQWGWTGFGPETSNPKQHAKTLWDWLQLLIIPVVLAIDGYVFNFTSSRNEQESTRQRDQLERESIRKRDQTEHEIALDNQREEALQSYIDKMSELLLDRNLRESQPNDEVRNIARVRTLTVLPRLDAARKGNILQFLYDARLLGKDNPILSLKGANFEEACLVGANLVGANLDSARLVGASLVDARLVFDNLPGANLDSANLVGANLVGANLVDASLVDASLIGANLVDAILDDAILDDAFLDDAFLDDAILDDAFLDDAILDDAILSKADFSHASNVTTEQLHKAKSLQSTILPNEL